MAVTSTAMTAQQQKSPREMSASVFTRLPCRADGDRLTRNDTLIPSRRPWKVGAFKRWIKAMTYYARGVIVGGVILGCSLVSVATPAFAMRNFERMRCLTAGTCGNAAKPALPDAGPATVDVSKHKKKH